MSAQGMVARNLKLEINGGGPVDVSALGIGDCRGFMSRNPEYRLHWQGSTKNLQFFFFAKEPSRHDATLIVRAPGGTWLCNDDANEDTLAPWLSMEAMTPGVYEVWVGNYDDKSRIPGILFMAGTRSLTEETGRWLLHEVHQGGAPAEIVRERRAAKPDTREGSQPKEFLAAAERGDAEAQYNTAWMYVTGRGVPQNDREAVRWFRAAAEQGDARAQYNLGVMHGSGQGVAQNDREAVRWFRAAAEQGDASAQYSLGVMYENGRGVPQNDREAVRWFRAAAEQGDAEAQHALGVMYDIGQRVAQSNREAVRWYRAAAEQGHASAQHNLGVMYATGRSVLRNDTEAHIWFSLAAANDDSMAQDNLSIVERSMTQAQIAEARRLAAHRHREIVARQARAEVARERHAARPKTKEVPEPVADPTRQDRHRGRQAAEDLTRHPYVLELEAAIVRGAGNALSLVYRGMTSAQADVMVQIDPYSGRISDHEILACTPPTTGSQKSSFCITVQWRLEEMTVLPKPPEAWLVREGIRVSLSPQHVRVSLASLDAAPQTQPAIQAGRVGTLLAGDAFDSSSFVGSYEIIHEEQTIFFEGDEYTADWLVLNRDGQRRIAFEVHAGDDGETLVGEIRVLAGDYATGGGVRVGTGIEDLLAGHPDAEFGYSYLTDEIFGMVPGAELDGVLFIVDFDDFTGNPDLLDCRSDFCALPIDSFRPGTAIREIQVL